MIHDIVLKLSIAGFRCQVSGQMEVSDFGVSGETLRNEVRFPLQRCQYSALAFLLPDT